MELSIIIPASKKNKYSNKGDLIEWGATTLFEWKVSQAKRLFKNSKIFVSTESNEIKKIAKEYNLNVINRKNSNNLDEIYNINNTKINTNYILYLFCTSPFLTDQTITKFIKNFFIMNKKGFDSALMYYLEHEYFYYKDKPVNFSIKNNFKERNKISPLKKITNGARIFKINKNDKKEKIFQKSYFQKINWIESLEIKETKNLGTFENILNCFNKN
jgi:CMP-N-acetylneuraminic acid synthetase